MRGTRTTGDMTTTHVRELRLRRARTGRVSPDGECPGNRTPRHAHLQRGRRGGCAAAGRQALRPAPRPTRPGLPTGPGPGRGRRADFARCAAAERRQRRTAPQLAARAERPHGRADFVFFGGAAVGGGQDAESTRPESTRPERAGGPAGARGGDLARLAQHRRSPPRPRLPPPPS